MISLVKEKALRKKELDRLRLDKIDSIGAAEDEPVSQPENTTTVTSPASEVVAPPSDKSKFRTEESSGSQAETPDAEDESAGLEDVDA